PHAGVRRRPADRRPRAAVRSGSPGERALRHAGAIRRLGMHAMLISTRKGLFVAEPAGGSYVVKRGHFIGDNVTLAMVDPRGGWYAALEHGHFGPKLHRSDDKGETWIEVATPAYPPKPEGLEEKDMFGRELKWATTLMWSFAPALDKDGAIWCGTIPGALFRSEDKGATWQINERLWFMDDRK